MATETLADVALTADWADIADGLPALVDAQAEIQNVGGGAVAIVSAGTDAPTGKSGIVLGPRERTTVEAGNVWARSLDGSGSVSVTLLAAS